MITLPAFPVQVALLGLVGLLGLASALAVALKALGKGPDDLSARIGSWWWIVGIFGGAFFLPEAGMLTLLGLVSYLALKEYLSLIPTRRADRRVLFWAYLAIPVQFWLIGVHWYGLFSVFVPVYMFMLIPARMILAGETRDFLRAVGTIHWGLMTTVYALGHAAYLVALPAGSAWAAQDGAAGGLGLLLYLLLITEGNDVAQYCWGKALGGRHKVVPTVSPKKSWEGLVGGVLTAAAASAAIGPFLTPMAWWQAGLMGLGLGVAGFFGDVTVSAVKRDLGIKDSGSILPGHGGILDRVDSLVFTAPLFFHVTRYFWF